MLLDIIYKSLFEGFLDGIMIFLPWVVGAFGIWIISKLVTNLADWRIEVSGVSKAQIRHDKRWFRGFLDFITSLPDIIKRGS